MIKLIHRCQTRCMKDWRDFCFYSNQLRCLYDELFNLDQPIKLVKLVVF